MPKQKNSSAAKKRFVVLKSGKIKKAKQMAEHSGVLPKEMPIEKKFFLEPNSDSFERIKDKIQVSIDQMKR